MEQMYRLVKGTEDNATLTSFVEFAKQYEKFYSSEKEMLFRLQVFKEGVAKAKKLDEESKTIHGSTARFGITMFSDVTEEEFKSQWLMKKMPEIPQDRRYPNFAEPNSTIEAILRNNPTVPAAFDWRNRAGAVTGVYNQGQCGSCWAFSATENHESRWALQHNTGATPMSVQQIIDCDAPQQYGCNGGWPYQAWEYIQSQGGQDAWSCYPYQGYSAGCRWNGGCNAGSLVSWSWIYPNNEPGMQAWMSGNAPISICVDASTWSYYQGGVMVPSQCAGQTDHCVLATGWNMNSNPPYWNVRNSWGTGWGMQGYIALQYIANCCGMAQYPASCHTVNGV